MCFVCKDNKPNSWKECFIYSASGAYYLIERQVSAGRLNEYLSSPGNNIERERANEQCKCLTFSNLPHCVLNSVSAIFMEVINFTHSDRFFQSEPIVHVIGFSVLFPPIILSVFIGLWWSILHSAFPQRCTSSVRRRNTFKQDYQRTDPTCNDDEFYHDISSSRHITDRSPTTFRNYEEHTIQVR